MNNDIHIVKVGPHQQDTVMYTDGVCRCICVGQHNNTNSYLKILDKGRVRKMTTKEIGRLMGVDDQDIDKMTEVLSPGTVNSLFGNSIVVDVMTEVFRELFYEDRKKPEEIRFFLLIFYIYSMKIYRIRKMTPRECGRLMDVDDPDIDKMLNCGLSDNALYKLYGNSIVVACMVNIFEKLFVHRPKDEGVKLWE